MSDDEREYFGLDKELHEKANAKYSLEDEAVAIAWVNELTGEEVVDFWGDLKSGTILCKLMNVLKPNAVAKFSANPKHWLEEKDNLKKYLIACKEYGVVDHDQLTESDMSETKKDKSALLRHLHGLSRQSQARGFSGPTLGPRYYKSVEDQERLEKKKEEEREKDRIAQLEAKMNSLKRRKFLEVEHQERSKRNSQDAIKRVSKRKLEREQSGRGKKLGLVKSVSVTAEKISGAYDRDTPVKYGMDLEHHLQMENSFDHEGAYKVMDWIEDVCGFEVDDLMVSLSSGVILCHLINGIRKGTIKKITTLNKPLLQRDNLTKFLEACKQFGVKDHDLFAPNDLIQGKNLKAVVNTLFALHRVALAMPSFDGPTIDKPKKSHSKRTSPFGLSSPSLKVPKSGIRPIRMTPLDSVAGSRSLFSRIVWTTCILSGLIVLSFASYVAFLFYSEGETVALEFTRVVGEHLQNAAFATLNQTSRYSHIVLTKAIEFKDASLPVISAWSESAVVLGHEVWVSGVAKASQLLSYLQAEGPDIFANALNVTLTTAHNAIDFVAPPFFYLIGYGRGGGAAVGVPVEGIFDADGAAGEL